VDKHNLINIITDVEKGEYEQVGKHNLSRINIITDEEKDKADHEHRILV
jgi:hypothetical protein